MVKKKSKGWDLLHKKYDKKDIKTITELRKFSPDFVDDIIVNFGFGNLWQRKLYNEREKEMLVLASLITQGCVEDQLRGHIHTALKRGLSKDEIKEIAIILSGYIGIPRCLKALLLMREILEEKGS